MDTHDVSRVPEYLQYLRGHRQTLQKAQSSKGQRFRATKPRDQVVMQFMFQQMMSKNTPLGPGAIHSSFLPPAYAPCIASLSDLKKAMFKDLTLETHHRGCYTLLRAVTPTDTMTAVMAIVEDEEGDVLMLQLFNQEKELAVDGHLTEGTVMIVKEPYLKVMSDGDYGIRVDHLSDVLFIREHDSLIPLAWRHRLTEIDVPADDWKMKGNDCFNKAGYHLAIKYYSKALESSPTDEEILTIKLNRALTFLKTHQFDAALLDLEGASSGSKPSEKALFRKAQALYHLQRFRESCDVHKMLSKEYPENTAATKEFSRAIVRLAEQESGNYQFKRLQLEATKRRPPHLDRATYIGPVSVRPTESHGRGLFTTDVVRAGELLFCEKAFAYAFHNTDDPSMSLALLINAQTDRMTMGTQAELIQVIVQKLYKNPSRMSTFTDLHRGSYKPVNVSEVDNIPVVDTFLTERIMALNCFGCPLSSRESHIRAMSDESQQANTSKQFHPCGVWPLASHINHSCYSTARRSFIGDMMVVRATRDLAPNTEITFCYQLRLDNDAEEPMDLQHWGFTCSCIICQDYQKTKRTDLTKRKRLRADLLKAFQSHKKSNAAKIEAILPTIAETYCQAASEVPRLSIWGPHLGLANMYTVHNQSQKVIYNAMKALESLGYVVEGGNLPRTSSIPLLVKKWGLMTDSLVGCWMMLSGAYRKVAPDLEARAEEYARITYRICVGEDETFDKTYGRFSGRPDGLLAGAK